MLAGLDKNQVRRLMDEMISPPKVFVNRLCNDSRTFGDKKNDTSNSFSITVGETDKEFSFNFKVENIKILPGTYEVVVSQKLLSRFVNADKDLTYYIALEPDSTFG